MEVSCVEGRPRLATCSQSFSESSQHLLMCVTCVLQPQELEQACERALLAVTTQREAVLSQRQPLRKHTQAKLPTVKLFNPRFEDDFVAGKDYDPDRCAVDVWVLAHDTCLKQPRSVCSGLIWMARFVILFTAACHV